MLDWRGSSPRSTLLEKLVSQFTQNVQFSFVAGVAVLGPLGASVDVTDARNAGDEQVGEIVAGRVTRTQRRCGDSTGNPATFHSGTAARRQDAGLGVQ